MEEARLLLHVGASVRRCRKATPACRAVWFLMHPIASILRPKAIVRRRRATPPSPLADALLAPASSAYERCVAATFSVPERDEAERVEQWKADSAEARGRLEAAGCPLAFGNPWTDTRPTLRGLAGTGRQKDILDVAFLSSCHQLGLHPASREAEEAARGHATGSLGLLVDVSQSVQRRPWSLSNLHTVTTSTKAYSCLLERVLAPEEVLLIYGWPRAMAEANHNLGRAAMRNLVGETMALPTIAVAMVSMLVTAYH